MSWAAKPSWTKNPWFPSAPLNSLARAQVEMLEFSSILVFTDSTRPQNSQNVALDLHDLFVTSGLLMQVPGAVDSLPGHFEPVGNGCDAVPSNNGCDNLFPEFRHSALVWSIFVVGSLFVPQMKATAHAHPTTGIRVAKIERKMPKILIEYT